VLCALEVVKINILGGVCAEPKEVCVLGDQGHFFGGVVSNLGLVT